MPSIPVWLTGRNVTAVTITGQTNTAGVLANSTPVATMIGHVDEVTVRGSKTTENIKPMNTVRRNMVPIDVGTQIDLVEIIKYTGTNMLADCYYGSGAKEYYKVALTRGAQAFVFYGLLSNYEESWRHGKSVGTATFEMVDPAESNPSYT